MLFLQALVALQDLGLMLPLFSSQASNALQELDRMKPLLLKQASPPIALHELLAISPKLSRQDLGPLHELPATSPSLPRHGTG